MPSRTYSGIDLLNYTTSFLIPQVGAIATTFGQGAFSLSFAGADGDTIAPGSGGVTDAELPPIDCVYQALGDFDYTIFPSIPENAIINSLDFRINGTANATFLATITSGGPAANSTLIDGGLVQLGIAGALFGFLPVSATGGTPPIVGTTSISLILSDSDGFSIHNVITFTPAITRAQLMTDYPSIQLFARLTIFDVRARAGEVGAGANSSVSADLALSFNGFFMTVAYESGPEIVINLDPPGGNVHPGEVITVTADKDIPADAVFVAKKGDDVIPLVPKKKPDGTVDLEIPSPGDDECYDCFADCEDCEDCFAACEEDLDSKDCVKCLEGCLECLKTCLESVEYAEACLEAVNEPPDVPIPIVIICTIPTWFDGNVPLGNFTILPANGSGIYRLTNSKTNDTLYSSVRDGTTYDVKIPNPFGKTGFFRS